MAFWVHKGVIKEEKVLKTRKSGSNINQQSNNAESSDPDPIRYFVVDRYEMQKDHESKTKKIIIPNILVSLPPTN